MIDAARLCEGLCACLAASRAKRCSPSPQEQRETNTHRLESEEYESNHGTVVVMMQELALVEKLLEHGTEPMIFERSFVNEGPNVGDMRHRDVGW